MSAGPNIEVLLDDARPGQDRLQRFSAPLSIIQADAPEEIEAALRALETARRNGRYLAGYFTYELGYALEQRLRPLLHPKRDLPLLWFGIFEGREIFEGRSALDALKTWTTGRAYAGPLSHAWNAEAYTERFARTQSLIGAGDIYQANLSFRSRFPMVGDPMALYLRLRERSKGAQGAFVADGSRHILSLSPELFFSISAGGEIVAKPMKGTRPRGADPESDMTLRNDLQGSAKDRAENLMIVDLLRNDLGRVAQMGSVSVENIFAIESYPTVHQMISTVRARLKPQTSISDLLHALFPCGSVTGTPKVRAMEVIRELEPDPRGVYCGAIGHFAPDGSAAFNVAIRTLTISNDHGELGIGGAVVHDSRAGSEYEECLLKALYYEATRKPLELIETLRFSPHQGFVRQDVHLRRMERSATAFSIPFDRRLALRAMAAAVSSTAGEQRVRLAFSEAGSFVCTTASLPPAPIATWRYAISPVTMASGDILLRHKTNWREAYEEELSRLPNCDEVLFVNERGHVTEGSKTNVFVRREGRLVTPPLEDGLLDGCLRRTLIDDGACVEGVLLPRDLETGDDVFLGNSLRGLIKAVPAVF
ncbi:MAG: aminodeoxychorismate synthase component I [Rhizomicrobium sp.]